MTQFKNAYDLVNARSQKVKDLALEIETKIGEESDEAIQEALDLRPALEEAEEKLVEAKDLYQKLQDSTKEAEDVASLFVPVSEDAAKVDAKKDTISREEYLGLNDSEQSAFLAKGGKIGKEE